MDGLFLFLWNPLVWILVFLGYILMFALASVIAPKVAGRLSGKFSLYTSMIILFLMIVFIFTATLLGLTYLLMIGLGAEPSLQNAGVVLSGFVVPLMIFVILMNLITYIISPYLINLMYRARHDPRIQEIVDRVARRVGLSKPPKAVVVEGPPNAFAYGNFVSGRYVAVTSEMLNMTSDDELEAVIGHELGHHIHKDNMIMLFLGILPAIIYYLGINLINISLYRMGLSNRRQSNGGIILLAAGFVAVMISFLLQILVLAFSRLREYYADTVGVRAAGKDAMQRALAKIHIYYNRNYRDRMEIANSKLKTLFIYALTDAVAEPYYRVSREDIERIMRMPVSTLEEIFATHPPMPKRLRFIESLSWL